MNLASLDFSSLLSWPNSMLLAVIFYLNRMDVHIRQIRRDVTSLSGKPLEMLADHETRITVLEER